MLPETNEMPSGTKAARRTVNAEGLSSILRMAAKQYRAGCKLEMCTPGMRVALNH